MLNAAYEQDSSEELLRFVSELNPFIWKDRGSADPDEFIKFDEAFREERLSGEAPTADTYGFVRGYIESTHPSSSSASISLLI